MFDAIAFVLVKSMQSNAFFYDYAEKQVTGVENFVFSCQKKKMKVRTTDFSWTLVAKQMYFFFFLGRTTNVHLMHFGAMFSCGKITKIKLIFRYVIEYLFPMERF